METLINKLADYIKDSDNIKPTVSAKSVGWQIDHSLKVIIGSSTTFLNSTPAEYKFRLSFTRSVLYTLNSIPRGKGKAPKSVIYTGTIEPDYLLKNIEVARENLKKLNTTEGNYYFEHYLFGHLNKKRYLKFVALHTNHHLKIIRDILK